MKRLFVLLTAALTVLTVSCKKDQHNTDETTADTTIKVPVPEAVDLGLSVLWADRNLGAEKETDLGFCFAWGETKPRPYETFARPYIFDATDAPEKLSTIYDAAKVLLGNGWRMPTKQECLDLDQLEKALVTKDGSTVVGLKLSGNGNSISIPFPKPGGDQNFDLWTSERSDPEWAYICYTCSNVGPARREYANPIRPVKDK